MPSLVIPPNGLSLEGSGKPAFDQGDIIGLTLSDDVIEGMIQSVRKGEPINLSLGHDPVSGSGSGNIFLGEIIVKTTIGPPFLFK
jgi:hypothetical protein